MSDSLKEQEKLFETLHKWKGERELQIVVCMERRETDRKF
jgi:hypothetical protein